MTNKTKSAPEYTAFIESLQLSTIGLHAASCALDRDEYWERDTEKKLDYRLASTVTERSKKHFDAKSSLTLTLCDDKSPSPVLRVEVTFDLHFHGDSIIQEFVDKFCESEMRLIVWPYFREYVSNLTGRMHIPPVILPLSDKER